MTNLYTELGRIVFFIPFTPWHYSIFLDIISSWSPTSQIHSVEGQRVIVQLDNSFYIYKPRFNAPSSGGGGGFSPLSLTGNNR